MEKLYFEEYYLPPKSDYYILAKPLMLTILCISHLLPALQPHLPFTFLIWEFITIQSEMINQGFLFFFNQFATVFILSSFCRTWFKRICFMTLFFLFANAGVQHIKKLYLICFTGFWWHHVNMEGFV